MIITKNNYVKKAENAIIELKNKKNKMGKTVPMVTTSKIRNILAMSAQIYNDVLGVIGDELSDDINARIDYLKLRIIYEVGRDTTNSVRNFVESAELIKCIEQINGSRENYRLFNNYMEALVAYHKYYGGKE